MEDGRKLGIFEKILAVTNGSITQLLEVYTGEPVRIRTLRQEISGCDEETAKRLGIARGGKVNFREVEITDRKGNVLVFAKSLAPIERLDGRFREDLMKADVPIGKLFVEHGIEARRELLSVNIEGGNLTREYNIIHGGKILMSIEERFKLGVFK